MNTLDSKYQDLLVDILTNGVKKEDRTGTGTISVFGRQIRHNMKDGFPLLTTKKMHWNSIVIELLWFLQGRTDLRYLLQNNCHIWTGDAYLVYDKDFDREHPPFSAPYPKRLTQKEFEEKIMSDDDFNKWYGDLGPIYGKQWRDWGGTISYRHHKRNGQAGVHFSGRDQIIELITQINENPDSRRLMVSAWNVGELDQMVLPPCHYGFQVYTRELSVKERLSYFEEFFDCTPNSENMNEHEIHIELSKSNIPTRAISLMWNQRSVDTFLGLPFNIASYGLLLNIIAKAVNMVPDELIGNLGDVHLYSNHVEQAKEQIGTNYSLEERLELLYKKEPNFNAEEKFGIAHHIENFCHYVIDEYSIPRKTREPFTLPKLDIKLHFRNEPSFVPEYWKVEDFELIGYQSHPAIKAELSN